MSLPVVRQCRRCRGTGARHPNSLPAAQWPVDGGDGEPCPSCDGRGWVNEPLTLPEQRAMERAARICEDQIKVFLDPRYAANQPASSMAERFACAACAREIRKAAGLPDPHAETEQ